MKDLLAPGAAALTLVTLVGVAGCNQQQPQPEKVVEPVVVHDRPVIVRQEGDRRDGDPDHRGDPQDNRR